MLLNYDSTQQAQQSLAFFNSHLFHTVQMSHLFTDSKTFADAIPKMAIKLILAEFNSIEHELTPTELLAFVEQYFDLPNHTDISVDQPSTDINAYIEILWGKLEKSADEQLPGSLLPLNSQYIVPGGRFREIYYWDSYFTALGLIESNRTHIAESMLTNFIDLQTRYACIPNGNRSYYLSRSQPPILGLMLELLLPLQTERQRYIEENIAGIEAEYRFWMQGHNTLTANCTEHKRVVRMPCGAILNRYWDDNASPRPESYREDMELLQSMTNVDEASFFRNIRAACESGWDFSSRWLGDKNALASIQTTSIIPVDLNCLLYKLEMLLAQYHKELGFSIKSQHYAQLADTRKHAINRYMWCDKTQYFLDYNLATEHLSPVKSLAGVLPLFVGLATQAQANSVANMLAQEFLSIGGLVTTVNTTEQQWDSPNGWAPLQWFTTQGLAAYQHHELANNIKRRWVTTIEKYFAQTGKLMEKYNVCQQENKAQGGEYDVQEGFGWTNGVYQAFKKQLAE